MNYKLYKELQADIRKDYLETTGKKTIPAEYNQGVNDALTYILDKFSLTAYRESGVFCVRPNDTTGKQELS